MKLISHNPFRIIGLPAYSKEKDFQRQRAKFKALLNVGREPASEFDFPFLARVIREDKLIAKSLTSIEDRKQRLAYSLFWFTSAGNSDELAFECLHSGDIEKASDIWLRIADAKSAAPRRLSALNNLGTLSLELALSKGDVDPELFTNAVSLKRELIDSAAFADFVRQYVNSNLEKEELTRRFLDLLISDPDVVRIGPSNILGAFSNAAEDIRLYLLKLLEDGPVARITAAIKESEKKRKERPEVGGEFGRQLYIDTGQNLEILEQTYGRTSIEYGMHADRVANEIFYCGLSYYNYYRDDLDFNPFPETLYIFGLAAEISMSESVSTKIANNISLLQKWSAELAKEEEKRGIVEEIEQLTKLLQDFQNKPAVYENALNLVLISRPLLVRIREARGSGDELYIQLSCRVVRNSQGMMKRIINTANELFSESTETRASGGALFQTVIAALDDAGRLKNLLSSFDMDKETHEIFDRNNQFADSLYWEFRSEYKPGQQKERIISRTELLTPITPKAGASWVFLTTLKDRAAPAIVVVGLIVVLLGISIFTNSGSGNRNTLFTNANVSRSGNNTNFNKYSPSPADKIKMPLIRPGNGETLYVSSGDKGSGSLFINNGTENDALIELLDLDTGKTYRQVYVRGKAKFKISGIKTGTYTLKYSTGKNYSPEINRFISDEVEGGFKETLDYSVSRNRNRSAWRYRATL